MARHLSPAQVGAAGIGKAAASRSTPRGFAEKSQTSLVGLRRSFAGSLSKIAVRDHTPKLGRAPSRHFGIGVLCSCLALVSITVGCKKRVGQGTISQPTIVACTASPEPPAPEMVPGEIPVGPELPGIEVESPTPLSEAEDQYRNLDLGAACSLYRELWRAGAEPLPWEAAARAVMACAVGSEADQQLAQSWLQLMIPEHDELDEQELTLHIVGRLLQQLRQQVESAAEREAKLAQLSKELENLKKIDARRRRP